MYADITTVPADAIVSSDDNYLSMGGGVSQAIRYKAGASIREEIKKHLPMKIGEVAVTSAGNLGARYIFHGITIDFDNWEYANEEVVRSIVNKSLELAETLGLKTISFPALGTGVAKFPFQLAAKTMTNAITDYLQKETKLEQVNLCLFAAERVRESDLNTFYEQAVGLASISAQSNRLDLLLSEVKEVLIKVGKRDLVGDVLSLQKKISASNQEIATHVSDNEVFRKDEQESKPSPLDGLSEEISAFSRREQELFNDRELELKLLRTKLSGLYTTLNIKQAQLNHYQIEEAKYGGQLVPPRLAFAIKDLKEEMEKIEADVRRIRERQVGLTG
ncbi:MAG: macro domain-containing protein [Lewinellaceae bacterium]|nr:macro domain-containing protein [Lewinellaceae bacterium]